MDQKQYTLGRGKVYFSRFKPGTRLPAGFLYIGNTPELNLTIESETLDHFDSDEGVREKDDSADLQTNRTGTMICDNIAPENVALFFLGEASKLAVTGATGLTETETVSPDYFYQLGVTESSPTGVRGVDPASVVIEDAGGAGSTYVLDTDYTVNKDTGMVHILPTGAIAADTEVDITYDIVASTRAVVLSGSKPVEGMLMYIANNPKGKDLDYRMAYMKVTPNGDFALKGDEWQQLPFNLEILKPTNGAAITVDGRPVYS